MKRKPIDMQSASIPRVLAVIQANPGILSRRIAELCCYSRAHTKNALTVISNAGTAKAVPIGVQRGWYMADLAAPLLEKWERTRRRRDKNKPKQPTKRDAIFAMSKEPEGVRMAQIMEKLGACMNAAGRHCMMMVGQGRIHKSQRQGARVRWFDTAERAQAWASMPPMEPSEWSEPGVKAWANHPDRPRNKKEQIRQAARQAREERRQQRLVDIGEKLKSKARQPSKAPPKLAGSDQGKYAVIRAKPAVDAPVVLHGKPSDIRGAVDYSKAKITRDDTPKFDHRYQLPPGAVVVGEFSRQWQQLRGQA